MFKSVRTAVLTSLAVASAALVLLWYLLMLQQAETEMDKLTDAAYDHARVTTEAPEPPPERVTAPQEPQETEAEETTETTPAETEPTETEPAPDLAAYEVDAYAAELIGRTIWGEAGGIKNTAERAAVAWCILNRVDAWDQTIEQVVTKPYQFQGYRARGECPQEHIDLAADVLARWAAEKGGASEVGRVLPADYFFFMGDGKHNHFTTDYKGTDFWDWSLTDPYK